MISDRGGGAWPETPRRRWSSLGGQGHPRERKWCGFAAHTRPRCRGASHDPMLQNRTRGGFGGLFGVSRAPIRLAHGPYTRQGASRLGPRRSIASGRGAADRSKRGGTRIRAGNRAAHPERRAPGQPRPAGSRVAGRSPVSYEEHRKLSRLAGLDFRPTWTSIIKFLVGREQAATVSAIGAPETHIDFALATSEKREVLTRINTYNVNCSPISSTSCDRRQTARARRGTCDDPVRQC